MNRLARIQQSFTKATMPKFEVGDTVRVHVKVVEGEKERIQVYEGAVIARKGTLNTETFTVRKVSYGVGVERIFPVHSPIVTNVDVVRQGRHCERAIRSRRSWAGRRRRPWPPSASGPCSPCQALLSPVQEGQVCQG